MINNVDKEKLKEIFDEFIGNNDFRKIINSENKKRVFQKLIKNQDKNANDEICKIVCNSFLDCCKDKYISFIIETLLLNCNEEYINSILEKCCDNLMELIEDMHGCRIVCCLISSNQVNIDKLFELIKKNILNIGQKQFGVLVIREIIISKNQSQKSQIINEIIKEKNFILLSTHHHGNYVVQEIFECSDQGTKDYLKNKIKSIIKYAKYVLKKSEENS